MNKLSKYRYLIVAVLIIAATLLVDVVSKQLVHTYIPLNDGKYIVVIPHLFSINHVENTGAAFSFGADNATALKIFIALTFVCILVIAFAIYKWGSRSKLLLSSLALIFSGALGNLIDRLARGAVDDFINFEFWRQFPTFNVADICVCVGAVLFVVYVLFYEGKDKKPAPKEAEGPAHE